MTRRDPHVDTLRGLACLLLVAYHVIGGDPTTGLEVADGPLRIGNDALNLLRMPLFTFLSGMVYAWRPLNQASWQFVRGKARRLLLPMLTVGTAIALAQHFIPGTHAYGGPFPLIHILPVFPFWFVEALFWVFMVIIPLEHFGLLKSLRGSLLVLALGCAASLSPVGTPYFAVHEAFYLFPFFIAGMLVERFSLRHKMSLQFALALMAAIGTFIAFVLATYTFADGERRDLTSLVVGLSACTALVALRLSLPPLAAIGVYSYSIFLFHVFFYAGSRIVLSGLGLNSDVALFCVGLLFGLAGPIAMDHLLGGTNWTRMALLGKSRAAVADLWLTRRLPAYQAPA